jgi:hypothetical protein
MRWTRVSRYSSWMSGEKPYSTRLINGVHPPQYSLRLRFHLAIRLEYLHKAQEGDYGTHAGSSLPDDDFSPVEDIYWDFGSHDLMTYEFGKHCEALAVI